MQRAAFRPYEGGEPFIFISYAHKNSADVFPILEKMDAAGYRVWYDDGIAPGSEWPEYIAEHLNASSVVVAFVSPASIDSPNCRREVTYALAKQKPFLGVLLEETKMSPGMELQLAAQQCILRYNYVTEEEFLAKLLGSEVLRPCLRPAEEIKTQTPAEAPVTPAAEKPKAQTAVQTSPKATGSVGKEKAAAAGGKSKTGLIIGIAAAAIALIVGGILFSGKGKNEEPDASKSTAVTTQAQTKDASQNTTEAPASSAVPATTAAPTEEQTEAPPEETTAAPEEVPLKGELVQRMSVTGDNSKQYAVYAAGVICVDQDAQKMGLTSYDGKSTVEAIYPIGSNYGDYEDYEGLYLIVSTDGSAAEKTAASLNRLGVIDAKGNVIIPEGYVDILEVNQYYAICIRVTEETTDPEEAVITMNGTTFSADASKEDKVYFKGEWELISLKTGQPVPGIAGTKASEYGEKWKYSSYYSGELIELDYNNYIWGDGTPLAAGAEVFSNGSYVVTTPSKGTVYNTDGTERFTFDPNQFSIEYSRGSYFAARKLSDGSRGYTLLDKDGQPVSVEFSIKGYYAPISCGPFIIAAPEGDNVWHLYDLKGELVTDRPINQYYTEYDELHHVLKADTKEDTDSYLFFTDEGELLLEVSSADVRVSDFKISRKDNYYYYNFATKAFDLNGDKTSHQWWVVVRNDGGKYDLIDTFTGETLLRGYDSYKVVKSPEYGTVVGAKYNQTIDVFILR